MVTESHIYGEMIIKEMTTEMKTKRTDNRDSIENAKTVGKEVIGRLIVGQRRNKNKMTLTTFLWGTHSVEKYQNMT